MENETWQVFSQIKLQLDNLERERARGVIIKSKARWVEEGEKSTSYFLRLEKHNYCKNKTTHHKTLSGRQCNNRPDPKTFIKTYTQKMLVMT